MSELVKIGGLWEGKDKNGNKYFSGTFTYGTKLLVMSNSFKEKNNEHDYIVYITKKEKQEDREE
jgi:hypothetical protein